MDLDTIEDEVRGALWIILAPVSCTWPLLAKAMDNMVPRALHLLGKPLGISWSSWHRGCRQSTQLWHFSRHGHAWLPSYRHCLTSSEWWYNAYRHLRGRWFPQSLHEDLPLSRSVPYSLLRSEHLPLHLRWWGCVQTDLFLHCWYGSRFGVEYPAWHILVHRWRFHLTKPLSWGQLVYYLTAEQVFQSIFEEFWMFLESRVGIRKDNAMLVVLFLHVVVDHFWFILGRSTC